MIVTGHIIKSQMRRTYRSEQEVVIGESGVKHRREGEGLPLGVNEGLVRRLPYTTEAALA